MHALGLTILSDDCCKKIDGRKDCTKKEWVIQSALKGDVRYVQHVTQELASAHTMPLPTLKTASPQLAPHSIWVVRHLLSPITSLPFFLSLVNDNRSLLSVWLVPEPQRS